MPYTAKQHRLFEAVAHSKEVSKRTGIPQSTAKKMASEGVKADRSKNLGKYLYKKGGGGGMSGVRG